MAIAWTAFWSQDLEANLNSPFGSEAKLRSSCQLVFFQTVASPALSRQLNSLRKRVAFHCSFTGSISVQV